MKNSSQKFAKTESDLNDKSKNNTIQSAPFTSSELVLNVELLIKMIILEKQQYYIQLHVLQNIAFVLNAYSHIFF